MEKRVRKYLAENFPESDPKYKYISLGPTTDGKIEARLSGPNPTILRQLSRKTKDILLSDPGTQSIRDNWRQRLIVSRPIFSEALARATGVSRARLSNALQMTFGGLQVGLYRERDELIPIISRLPEAERDNISSMYSMFIWSPVRKANVPIQQVVQGFETEWEECITSFY